MLNENISRFRKAKGLSQEELAVKLNVVRQTVSKWENGLSVPDAEILVRIAELLEVSVNDLLGKQTKLDPNLDLAEELKRVNSILAEKNRHEKLIRQAEEKRNLIIFLSLLALIITVTVKNSLFAIILTGVTMVTAVIILYRNLALLTSISTAELKLPILRKATIFNLIIFISVLLLALLTALKVITLSLEAEKLTAIALTFIVMVFCGFFARKLPFNRHTGLRLPWTIRDEATWQIAHCILSYISLPLALLYLACALTLADLKTVTLFTIVIWLAIPGFISLIFYVKKFRGK